MAEHIPPPAPKEPFLTPPFRFLAFMLFFAGLASLIAWAAGFGAGPVFVAGFWILLFLIVGLGVAGFLGTSEVQDPPPRRRWPRGEGPGRVS